MTEDGFGATTIVADLRMVEGSSHSTHTGTFFWIVRFRVRYVCDPGVEYFDGFQEGY